MASIIDFQGGVEAYTVVVEAYTVVVTGATLDELIKLL